MHRVLSRSFIVALMLSGAAFAQSQAGDSLGDLARANRTKQQSQEASGTTPKVITNQDLPANNTGIPEASASDPMTQVSGVKRSDPIAEQRLGNRLLAEQHMDAQWRARIQEQESRIADLQGRIEHVNAAIRTSVGTAQYDTPANRYQAVQTERLAMMQEMLNRQTRRLALMEDAARRAGMNQ